MTDSKKEFEQTDEWEQAIRKVHLNYELRLFKSTIGVFHSDSYKSFTREGN